MDRDRAAGRDGEDSEVPVPEWGGPPADTVAGLAPLSLLLAESEQVTVHLGDARAYPTGATMVLTARLKDPCSSTDIGSGLRDDLLGRGGGPVPALRGGLWWGIDFPDGRHADARAARPETEHPDCARTSPARAEDAAWRPAHPVLVPNAGVVEPAGIRVQYWLWPLPPPGPLTITCRWPEQRIDTTTAQLQARYLLDAAARARPR